MGNKASQVKSPLLNAISALASKEEAKDFFTSGLKDPKELFFALASDIRVFESQSKEVLSVLLTETCGFLIQAFRSHSEEQFRQAITFSIEAVDHLLQTLFRIDREWLRGLLWRSSGTDHPLSIEVEETPNDPSPKIKINGRDYIASFQDTPLAIKLFDLYSRVFVSLASGTEPNVQLVTRGRWSAQVAPQVKQTRLALLSALLTTFGIEESFSDRSPFRDNHLAFFIKKLNIHEEIIKSLLQCALGYDANGIIPYSAYFKQESLEVEFKTAVIALSLAQFILLPCLDSKRSIEMEIMTLFLTHNQVFAPSFMPTFFKDITDLSTCMELILSTQISLYSKNNSLLPESVLESPFIDESLMIALLLSCKGSVVEALPKAPERSLLMSLLIILDNTRLENHRERFVILSLILNLTSCSLSSEFLRSAARPGQLLRLPFQAAPPLRRQSDRPGSDGDDRRDGPRPR